MSGSEPPSPLAAAAPTLPDAPSLAAPSPDAPSPDAPSLDALAGVAGASLARTITKEEWASHPS